MFGVKSISVLVAVVGTFPPDDELLLENSSSTLDLGLDNTSDKRKSLVRELLDLPVSDSKADATSESWCEASGSLQSWDLG